MADFERKLTLLAERGTHVGPEELIERIEAALAEDPLVVVNEQRKGWEMSVQADEKQERKQGSAGRGLIWAAAVFVLIVGVTALFIALSGEQEPDIAQQTTETTLAVDTTSPSEQVTPEAIVDVIESGLTAFYSGDFEAASALMDFETIDPTRSEQEWREEVAYYAAMNGGATYQCDVPGEGSSGASCATLYRDDLTRVIYPEPGDPDEFSWIGVADGKIISVETSGPDSLMWAMGIFLAQRGELSGFEGCMRGALTADCAEIVQDHLPAYEVWHAEFDATDLVSTGMEAWFEGDCALAITLFGGPVTDDLDDCLAGTVPPMMAYEREIGADVAVRECEFNADAERAVCIITYSNALNEAVGAQPAEMSVELLVTPVEKALWYYQREFYIQSFRYPHDDVLDASFQAFAEEQGFGQEHARACAFLTLDTECSQMRLENLEEWAVWHQANS